MDSVTFWAWLGLWLAGGMVAFSIALLDDDLGVQADEVHVLLLVSLFFGPISLLLSLVALRNNRNRNRNRSK